MEEARTGVRRVGLFTERNGENCQKSEIGGQGNRGEGIYHEKDEGRSGSRVLTTKHTKDTKGGKCMRCDV
jgi:hypothetical protein